MKCRMAKSHDHKKKSNHRSEYFIFYDNENFTFNRKLFKYSNEVFATLSRQGIRPFLTLFLNAQEIIQLVRQNT